MFSLGCSCPIVSGACCLSRESMTMGSLVSLQLAGQQDRVKQGVAQSTSGLCAFNQSVPNIKSWSPRDVTYNSDVSLW